MSKKMVTVTLLLLIAIACVLPFVLKSYHTFQATLVLVYAIALLGLNILTGYNGQISLGHGAFYAIGAYCAAILMDQAGLPYWATIPIAATVCLLIGFLFGLPALRLEGLYLALATFALGVSMPPILKSHLLETWTGGVQGIVIVKPDPPAFLGAAGIKLNADQWLYFFSLAVAIVLFVVGWNLIAGRIGRALIAIRDNPLAARAMGINTVALKLLAFGIGATLAGTAGTINVHIGEAIEPNAYQFIFSALLLSAVVLGGMGTVPGAVLGAALLYGIPEKLRVLQDYRLFLFGVALILLMRFRPEGIIANRRRQLEFHETGQLDVPETTTLSDEPAVTKAGA
jgi:branched-chain amino acid transport system permease protein